MCIVKEFDDGSILEYNQGGFDDWCIYLTRPNQRREAPRDQHYFTQLVEFAAIYPEHNLYEDLVRIYDRTGNTIDQNVLDLITNLAENYRNDIREVDIMLTTIYMGMVAEENKKNTRLGKKIKRLGFHQVLQDGLPPERAANFSRGMKAPDILEQCRVRGF